MIFFNNSKIFNKNIIDLFLKFIFNIIYIILLIKIFAFSFPIMPIGYIYFLLLLISFFEIFLLSGFNIIQKVHKIFLREIFTIQIIVSLFLFVDYIYNLILSSNLIVFITYLWTWLDLNPMFIVNFSLYQSQLFSIGVFLVIIASLFILSFSLEYIAIFEIVKFCLFILLFAIFMILNILSNDWILMFFGWEGIGLMSFLLINFWRHRHEANKSALKAFFVNKIGDSVIIILISLLLSNYKNASFETQIAIWYNPNTTFLNLIVFLLFVSVLGKSAQFFFHFWLDDAMEGPTPVSALIHAATLVTAGTFLILKNQSIFLYSSSTIFFLIIGILSSISGILTSLEQDDFKKTIAYTTLTNIGIIFIFCGLGFPFLAFIHLIIHGFYKALTFLSVGNLIHLTSGEQSNKFKGLPAKFIILDYFFIFVSSLMMMGFPFFGAFFSKETIFFLNSYSSQSLFTCLILLILIFGIFSNFSLISSFFSGAPSKKAKSNFQEFHRASNFLDVILTCFILITLFIPFLIIDFWILFPNSNILYSINSKENFSNLAISNFFLTSEFNSLNLNIFQFLAFFLIPALIFFRLSKVSQLNFNYSLGDQIMSGFVNFFNIFVSFFSKFFLLVFSVNEYVILEYVFFFSKKIYFKSIFIFSKNSLLLNSSNNLLLTITLFISIYLFFILSLLI